MKSVDKNENFHELAGKILAGIRKANLQMAEKAAANNEKIVIGDGKGGFKSVPAKELLKSLPK